MKRVEEVCLLSGVSRRTLQYYDDEGILPVKRSEENYRLYDEAALERLIVKEKLKETAELNTGSYLCTAEISRTDSRKFRGWKIPFTKKSFKVSYDGNVKVGIKDLTKTEVTQNEENIIVKLPEVEITGIEIDNNSFKMIDKSNNILNSISVKDLNDAQKDLKKKMEERAVEKGVLDLAKNNAEELIAEMLKSPIGAYDVKIEWQ